MAALLGDWKGEGGGAPQYRLTYTMSGPNRLGISFEVAPPGGPLKTDVTGVNTRVSEIMSANRLATCWIWGPARP